VKDRYQKSEIAAGLFVLLGLVAIAYLSISIGGLELFHRDMVEVSARFASVGDLKPDAPVKIAGVKVGRVKAIALADYSADVEIEVKREISLPTDTIASIRTEGLLGESYVLLRPGGSETDLSSGGRIAQTESAVDLIDLVVKYALEGQEEK
jgi:phospholipid/cholesterol/gamma-HCH transport system substrate-binding protein